MFGLPYYRSKMLKFVVLSKKKFTNTVQAGNAFQVLRGVQCFVGKVVLELWEWEKAVFFWD